MDIPKETRASIITVKSVTMRSVKRCHHVTSAGFTYLWFLLSQVILVFQSLYHVQAAEAEPVHTTLSTSQTSDSVNAYAPQNENVDKGIEEEVLGPLRIWHIVFIIGVILLTAVVVVCCCCNFRVPRTRQEIEDNYQKHLLNKQYLRVLERRPEELLKRHPARTGVSATEASKKLKLPARRSKGPGPSTKPKPKPKTENRNIPARATTYLEDVDSDQSRTNSVESYSPVARPRPKVGGPTPLARHPRDILSLMTQQSKKSSGRQGQ